MRKSESMSRPLISVLGNFREVLTLRPECLVLQIRTAMYNTRGQAGFTLMMCTYRGFIRNEYSKSILLCFSREIEGNINTV